MTSAFDTLPIVPPGSHEARVAIEALRAGVPNRAAIRLLGTREKTIEAGFNAALDAVWGARPLPGQVIAGGFGSGKSHLLGYLGEQALARNMVVSRVTVSKETPLAHPGLMFAAAMRGTTVPGTTDDIATVALSRVLRTAGAVQELELWASTPAVNVAPIFAAVAHLLGKNLAPELMQGIEAFLCGGKPPGASVRAKLAEMGVRSMFEMTGVKALQLDLQRPRFMMQLLRGAGFAGWCVMIDEVELIGRYGPAQRASAYAQLGRWLGLAPHDRIPGLHTVAAISDDFTKNVLDLKRDEEKVPDRLLGRGLDTLAALASDAMKVIRVAPILSAQTDQDLALHGQTLRRCYTAAYAWPAPPAARFERRANRSMRHHIRGWITEWDMQRLSGGSSGIVEEEMVSDYSENLDLETQPEDDSV
jgi:hypothetical protein